MQIYSVRTLLAQQDKVNTSYATLMMLLAIQPPIFLNLRKAPRLFRPSTILLRTLVKDAYAAYALIMPSIGMGICAIFVRHIIYNKNSPLRTHISPLGRPRGQLAKLPNFVVSLQLRPIPLANFGATPYATPVLYLIRHQTPQSRAKHRLRSYGALNPISMILRYSDAWPLSAHPLSDARPLPLFPWRPCPTSHTCTKATQLVYVSKVH